jgi:hypothetical protein
MAARWCFVQQNIDNVDDFCPETRGTKLRTLAEHRLQQQQQRTKRAAASLSPPATEVQLGTSPQIGDVQMWCGAVSEDTI